MDGEITIGTRLDTDKFDRQIKELEKKIKKEESTKDIKIKAVVETDRRIGEQKRKVDELKEKYNDLTQKIEHLNEVSSGKIKGTTQDWKQLENYSQLIAQQERMSNNISQAEQKQYNLNIQAEKAKMAYQQMKDNVAEYKQKIESVQLQKQVSDVEKLKQGFNNVGNSLESSIKKIARLALGIFGIRSAYMALRRASSDLASYDEQYATNLEYIRYALTQAVAPVLRHIVNLAATLLQYINMILNALFGINIFSRGSAESFNKMKAGASGVSKAVKEIKKQLAGFDEINMLTGQSDTGTAGGLAGVGVPSFDLSTFNIKQPKWLDWLVKNKKNILSILAGIAGALTTLKLGLGGLMALGVGVAIYGIIESVKGLLDFLKNPTWENFRKFLGGLATAVSGVAIAMIAFNATNPVGWILLAIGAITAITTAIIDLTQKLITNRARILDTKTAQDQLTEAQKRTKQATDAYINAVDNAEQAQRDLTDAERRNKMSGEELYRKVQEGTLDYQNMTSAQREVYKAYINNLSAQKELQDATKDLSNAKQEETKKSWENQLAIAKEKQSYNEFKEAVVRAFNEGSLSADEARDLIERAMSDMSYDARRTFEEDLPYSIRTGLNPDRYESAWNKFKRKWNEFIDGLKTTFRLNADVSYSISGGGGGSSWAKGGIIYHKLPKLASGGIINQPGRGVPLGGAIGGERGMERSASTHR